MANRPRKNQNGADRLQAYRSKRDFQRTKEPQPKVGKAKGRQFVVQKHAARRLHFDLRLELDGVLKSWAVTRGPSLVAGDKRLAVETEDHPLEYLDWEGLIPKGEYGGGTMIVWDRGTWAPEGDAHRGLKKGHLDFSLKGERLKGRWHLVRMQRKRGEKKTPWLLIKSKDEYARDAAGPQIVDKEQTSCLTGRTNAQLAARGDVRADHAARAKVSKASLPNPIKLQGARRGFLPPFVEPSLAQPGNAAPSGRKWVHEIKYDGYRTQARIDGGKVKLLTRKALDWTKRFRPIEQSLKQLPVGSALIDGEIVVPDANGIPSFANLQSDLKSGRKDRLSYVAFDLLYLNGVDLRGASLRDRKDLLRQVIASLPGPANVSYSEDMDEDGPEILSHVCRLGLEGIISKRVDLPYRSGRGAHWRKSKCTLRQEFVVVGYVPSTAARRAVGSLVLGYYERGTLMHAGRAGTGFSQVEAIALREALDKIAAAKPPFGNRLPASAQKGVEWAEPVLVAEIEYRGWSSDHLLWQASFRGLREDKAPSEIGLEQTKGTGAQRRTTSITDLHLTHPERILWEEQGITKLGLAQFYADIAKWVLPHIINRVLSLVRCPSGVGGHCFFAKHAWQGLSPAIRAVDIGEGEQMLAIDGLEGLIALVQAGVVEIHPWGSSVDDPDKPDRLIIDLDPGEAVPWSAVIEGARDVRDRLQQSNLKSFVKTSGGKGLHVVVPLTPKADWQTVKDFAREMAEQKARDNPQPYVAKMTKSRRRGRIFVDYLRNDRGATAVAPYSTRATQTASVSTPLAWSELSEAIGPDHFTVDNLR